MSFYIPFQNTRAVIHDYPEMRLERKCVLKEADRLWLKVK